MKNEIRSTCLTALIATFILLASILQSFGQAPVGSWQGPDMDVLTIGSDGSFDWEKVQGQLRGKYTLVKPAQIRVDRVTPTATNSVVYQFSASKTELSLSGPGSAKLTKFQRVTGAALDRAERALKAARPKLYDESADGSKQVAAAVAVAQREHKRVLLVFGANWCVWCRRLHGLFDSDEAIAAELRKNYVTAQIDVNRDHNKEVDAKYENPTQYGLPAIVVLDSAGKVLTTEDSGKLEEGDHHSPEKVMTFLKQWAPKD